MKASHTIVASACAAVLGAAFVAPLPLDGRVTVAIAIAALSVYCLHCAGQQRAWLAVAFAAAAADAWLQGSREPFVTEQPTARYTCSVVGFEKNANDTSSFACRLDGGQRLLVQARGSPPTAGARIIVRGRIEPFDDARNPGEPSERDIERERGYTARLASAQILRTMPSVDNVEARAAELRAWGLEQLRARIPEPQASLIAGELWGERANLPPDVRDEFQETGTVHVLVTAGLHLGVVAFLALWLLEMLRAPRIVTCAGAIACAWSYAWLAGAHIPSLRAATMLTFALTARACGRKALSWNAIAAAALAIVILRPLDVTSASFALSFSCVAAILSWATPIDEFVARHVALPERAREAIALATATQIGTWPLTAAIFLQFAPYAILANIVVVPVVGSTMLLAGASIAFAWIPPLAQACANLAGWGATWMLDAVHTLASLPHAKIPMTPAPAWCIASYDACALSLPWLLHRKRYALGFALFAVAIALVLWPPRIHDTRLRITVLDVGQADAIVVQTPGGHAFLVDAGGQLERGSQTPGDSTAERVGERIVVPFLLRHGIHSLDAIVVSHPHGDHVGGCTPVLRALRVAEVADGGQRYGGHAYHDCLETASTDRVAIVYPRAGMIWRTSDGITLTFIGPSPPFIDGKNAINDNSVAFILQYRAFRMLFTGDAGVAAERRFLSEGIDLHADVLKVGHHGSAYSSSPDFIAAVHPKYSIVSVGRHNLFGHPARSTVETLQRFGSIVYRTDEDGAVIVTADGASRATTLITYLVGPENRPTNKEPR